MERNYKEDQANEIEALESIYCDDMESKRSTHQYLFNFHLEKFISWQAITILMIFFSSFQRTVL